MHPQNLGEILHPQCPEKAQGNLKIFWTSKDCIFSHLLVQFIKNSQYFAKCTNLLCLMRTDTKSHLQLKDLYQEKMCTCTSIYCTAEQLKVCNKHGRNKGLSWGSGRVINWPKLLLLERNLQGDAKIDRIGDTILKESFLNQENRPKVPLLLENCFEKNLRTSKWIWHINRK